LAQGNDDEASFEWSVGDDRYNSVLAFLRRPSCSGAMPLLVVCNFTPVVRHDYLVGVPAAGGWDEVLNTDSAFYGGSNIGNGGRLHAVDQPMHGHPQALSLTLPPLATVYLRPRP
jgi:1,4-alpha-glucan branching enzyme